MKKLLYLLPVCLMIMLASCKKETCTDEIQNQDETGIDCGGKCSPCPSCFDDKQNQDEENVDCGGPCEACPTCFDGIQNQDETGVDCGGPCQSCEPTVFRATVEGQDWQATSVVASEHLGSLTIHGLADTSSILIQFNGPFQPGTYPMAGFTALYSKRDGQFNCVSDSGKITFTVFNTIDKTVTGTFYYWCTDVNAGGTAETAEIASGIFTHIKY